MPTKKSTSNKKEYDFQELNDAFNKLKSECDKNTALITQLSSVLNSKTSMTKKR